MDDEEGKSLAMVRQEISTLKSALKEAREALKLALEEYMDSMEHPPRKHWCLSNKEEVANKVAEVLTKIKEMINE